MHETSESKYISLCDSDLIGKKFEDENFNLNVREKFYGGEELNQKKFDMVLKDVSSLNVVGKESIGLCLRKGLLKKENIKRVGGVVFAIIVLIK